MRVILAEPRGFCAGVVRAIDIVDRTLEKYGAPVYVRHEIVHNRRVVDGLRRKGAVFVESLADIPEQAVAVFSAHGVGQKVEAEARQRGLHVLDATCPLVAKVHVQARRYASQGKTVVLIGHAGHPEVVGTLDQAPDATVLVESKADVAALPFAADAPLAYITQTTLSVDDTRDIIAALKQRYPGIVGPDVHDICYATQNRQTAVRELCRRVELMLVIGARYSSNTVRLHEIALESGIPSHLIADASELGRQWFQGIGTVGVTAGASAPETLVDEVIAVLRTYTPLEIETLSGRRETAIFPLPTELLPGTASAVTLHT